MNPQHHPSDDLLFDYGTGSLPEPAALAVASHVAWCGDCQARTAEIEALGGAVLDAAEAVSVDAGALEAVLARLDEPVEETPRLQVEETTRRTLPSPLWPYVGGDMKALRWKRRGKGVETAAVPMDRAGYSAYLLRIQPGHSVPVHTHGGIEFTMVLEGAYHDGEEHFAKGDLQIADASINHQPVADRGEVCLCFAVLDLPLKFTGPIARFVDPFIRL